MGMSTLSPSSFNDSLNWDLNIYESYNGEEGDDCEVLTALVRTSYLNHLQRSLTNNYEHWVEANQGNDDFKCCLDDIMKCANFLEHKALRACMITSYYQRAMVKTMKDIKRSTEEGSLFSPLIEQSYDNKIKKTCDKETQTNVSLITCRVDDDNHDHLEQQPSTVDITLENSNLIIINPCNDLMKEKDNNDGLEDLFNILMSSPNFPEKEVKEKFLSPKKRKYNDEPVHFAHTYDETIDFDISMSNGETHESQCNGLISYENEYNKHENFFDKSVPSKANNHFLHQIPVINDKIHSHPKPPSTPPIFQKECRKTNLDERLQTLAALFGDESPNLNNTEETNKTENMPMNTVADADEKQDSPMAETSFKLPLDWKTEYAAQSCHLKEILSNLSTSKRYILQKRFRELFGERTFHTSISINEEALCRKRTANIVVGELTPHYIAGRIASKEIFKSLARKITDDILVYSYVAGHDEIARRVNYYFENGKCINSERDIEST